MATTAINAPETWAAQPATQTHKTTIYNKLDAFADSQADSKTLWFLVSMIVQGVFFLPVPAALMYFYDAPIAVLIVTLSLFFANIIGGMGGASVRTLMVFFGISVVVHAVMVAVFVL